MLRRPLMILAALALGGQALPAPADRTAPAAEETLGYRADESQRMTLPVTVGGRGPFRFVVDTGAERTVISRELAQALGLSPAGDVWLASISEVRQVPTVMIPRLDIGRRAVTDIRAPTLMEEHLGAHGMLGVDSLQGQRIVFDFARRELRVARSQAQEERWPEGTIVVRGRTRLGRLVLADAVVEGQRVWAIVDTGSPVTIGNGTLRDRLVARDRLDPGQMIELTGVTGANVTLHYTRTRRIRLGQALVHDLPIAFSDLPLFAELGLADRPAILLGMDALQLFERVSIDFARRRVQLMSGAYSRDLQSGRSRTARSGLRTNRWSSMAAPGTAPMFVFSPPSPMPRLSLSTPRAAAST